MKVIKEQLLLECCLVRSVSTAAGGMAFFGHSTNELIPNYTITKTTNDRSKKIACSQAAVWFRLAASYYKQILAGGIHLGQDLAFLLLFSNKKSKRKTSRNIMLNQITTPLYLFYKMYFTIKYFNLAKANS